MSDNATVTLAEVRAAMYEGARLDVVRLLFNPEHKWGVQVYKRGKTRGGNDKWIKVIMILPNEGETVSDVLRMLGNMAEEAS